MSFNPEEYLHYFEGYDLSHEEKIEFIEALWLIAQSFADDGLGIGSAANDNAPKTGSAVADPVESDNAQQMNTEVANDNNDPSSQKSAA